MKISISIISGFLGSGKTTLLNHLLQSSELENTAIIVNEFGDTGIDGQLVIDTEDEVVELNNGCICCTVRDDLIQAIHNIIETRHVDKIIIETSGLADPAPVMQSFLIDEQLILKTEIDALITVVDASNIEHQIDYDEAQEQIAFADIILINKTDLVSPDTLPRLQQLIRTHNPMAKVISAESGRVDHKKLLGTRAFDLKNILSIEPGFLEDHEHDHDSSIYFIAIENEQQVDPVLFNQWLVQLLQDKGQDILRSKGILNLQDESRRYVFHGVHMAMDGRPGKPWGNDTRKNQLVFIGHELDEALLRSGFESTLI